MTIQLTEGQRIADYQLDRRLAEKNNHETWVATSVTTGDRVCLRILSTSSEPDWQTVADGVSSYQGLVHEHINLSSAGSDSGHYFLSEPYITGTSPLSFDHDRIWQQLLQVIDALGYAHRLNRPHGNLHPENVLIDPDANVHLTGFATPPEMRHGDANFQSMQVKQGQAPDLDDDLYSLGCILFRVLAGKPWQPGSKLDIPVPTQLESLLLKMLSDSPLERRVDLSELGDVIRHHYDQRKAGIETVDFTRSGPSPLSAAAPGRQTQASPELVTTRAKPGVSTNLVIAAVVVLVVFAGLLFLLLPQSGTNPTVEPRPIETVTQTTTETPATVTPAPPQQTPIEVARLEHIKKQAETVAGEIFRMQVDLEDQGINLWGGEDAEALNQQLAEAEAAFRESRFEDAHATYEEVKSGLQALGDQIPDLLAAEIEKGQQALAAGDADSALTAFTIANAISGDDAEIIASLERAENLDQVLRLVRQAEAAERDSDLDLALSTYSEARDLDALWQPAADGVVRIQAAIREAKFRAAMSDGFQAINLKNYAQAREAFSRAAGIKPGSEEPDEGLLQTDQAERNDIINVHRQLADQHMQAEAWQDAINEFEAALAVTPNLAFATQGLELATARLTMTEALNGFLSDPTQLQADDKLKEARSLLRDAARAELKNPESITRINTLAHLISMARVEVPVTIVSDGKTNVTVRKHARLGQIESQVVYLYPGRYTITGDRPGYRDVREDLIILAGEAVPTITISSAEKVR